MKSIFRRLLLWFGAMLVFSLVAFFATNWLITSRGPRPGEMLGRTLSSQLQEAVHAYESAGPEAVRAYFGRLQQYFPGRHHLTDASGRDLVTGEVRAAWKEAPGAPLQRPGMIKMSSADERYSLVVDLPIRQDPRINFLAYAWIVLVIVLLCYVLAVNLAAPLRQLRDVVVRFGAGDLGSRTHSSRTDELGQLSRSFDHMADRLQTLLMAERRLLQDVSHELRSPLARLEFAIELARTGPSKEADFARIKREVQRLTVLVDELLQVTRAEGDPSSRILESVDLDEVVESAATDARLEAGQRRITLDLHKAARIRVQGERNLLHRAVDNVLRNAIRHTPENSTIDIDIERENGSATVSIRDYGSGVPEEAVTQIFRPFYRVNGDRNRDDGGTGLGLAIAERAVRLHGGSIRAVNMHPGLMVEIKIPAAGDTN